MREPPESQAPTRDSVTPERFQQIRAVFEAAMELPAADRRDYAASACAGDAELLREVQAMLAADEKQDRLMNGARRGASRPPSSTSSSAPEEGRFPAGTVLAGRYRILGLLGQGGMGEVYRAFDVILNQTVALKFISAGRLGEAALARFRNEVRIARQVSHPNVCRVYDLGMVEGLHFLSMEYIDGEDLASLLRRIGRLPEDKAIEFTRKICAGLAAAHDRGVLHRDLKPANIMIDGRGQVRITDFGLAGLAEEIPLSDLGSGTPAYMSPEQKAGKEVTTRSDIYSLGLVLHEMFTGRSRRDTDSRPSELVKDLDPALDRLILRCLEEDPRDRPGSALRVARALPGGDPIAAALAAGETPSPEMVAASEEKEGFAPRTAVACFAVAVACLVAGTILSTRTSLLADVPLDIPPEVLAFRARELIESLGYTDPPAAAGHGFDYAPGADLALLGKTRNEQEIVLQSQQPPTLRFWYRQHQDRFFVDSFFRFSGGRLDYDEPASTEPGMVRAAFDPAGRLIELEARPGETGVGGIPDFTPLLAASGLDMTRFAPAEPRRIPPMAADWRMAWTGTYAEGRTEEVRVEAAAWAGRPVFFSVTAEGDEPAGAQPFGPPFFVVVLILVLVVGSLIGGVLMAWRNVRQGRSDRSGAARLAWVTLLSTLAYLVLSARHVAAPWEFMVLLAGLSEAALWASGVYAFYLAIEPYARRHWPDCLISWKRVQTGRFRDPLVASHVLAGVVVTLAFVRLGVPLLAIALSAKEYAVGVRDLSYTYFPVLHLVSAVGPAVSMPLLLLTAAVLLRLLLGRIWLADGLAAILLGFAIGPAVVGDFDLPFGLLHTIVFVAILLWLMRRFGLLAASAAFGTFVLAAGIHFIPGSWFAGQSLAALAIPAVVAAWALWVILSDSRGPSAEVA